MIKYRDQTFEDYSICPATGDIFDVKTGVVQKTPISEGRTRFKGMFVHRIMAHTFYGYKPGYVVHHLDENKLNNALSNLVYLTRKEHARLHHEGIHHSEETRAKISAASKGKTLSEEHKAKMSAARKGKKRGPLSEETKAKLSAAFKGKHLSEETKAKISTAMKGKHHSAETRAKMSESRKGKTALNKGKPRSTETKAKISAAMKGKHFSEEHKANLSAAHKGKPAWNKGKHRSK